MANYFIICYWIVKLLEYFSNKIIQYLITIYKYTLYNKMKDIFLFKNTVMKFIIINICLFIIVVSNFVTQSQAIINIHTTYPNISDSGIRSDYLVNIQTL